MAATVERLLGKSIKRREDPRFITGRGNYVDDLKVPGTTHAVFIRSPHAFAKIKKIDTAAALKHPGVVAIFTGADMTGVNSLPCGWLLPDLKVPPHMPLASDAAQDAAEKVKVTWEPVAAVSATDQATAAGSSKIHEVAPSNIAFKWQIGDA